MNEIEFLSTGAYDFKRLGLSFQSKAFLDSIRAKNEKDGSAWRKLTGMVENAKAGFFPNAAEFSEFIFGDYDTNLAPVAILLIGDMGTNEGLEYLKEIIDREDEGFSSYACEAAASAGAASLIPSMKKAWGRSESRAAHEMIGFAIADILESPDYIDGDTPISLRAGEFTVVQDRLLLPVEYLNFRDGVANKGADERFFRAVDDAVDRVGYDFNKSYWGGVEFNVYKFVEDFFEKITHRKFSIFQTSLTVKYRRKFEASTGIDCSSFYVDGVFDQLAALQIVEDFLERYSEGSFSSGKRYFYSHEIDR